MKTVKKGKEWDQENDEKEVDLLQRLRHENIIRYFEHFDESIFDSEYFCVVCELCEVRIIFQYIQLFNINLIESIIKERRFKRENKASENLRKKDLRVKNPSMDD